MRDLIVCCTPGSTVLRGRLLDRFAQWWDRRALAVDLVSLDRAAATLEVRVNGVLIATATATELQVQHAASHVCPRCLHDATYELVTDLGLLVMAGCRRCGWRSTTDAEYDLGRTA